MMEDTLDELQMVIEDTLASARATAGVDLNFIELARLELMHGHRLLFQALNQGNTPEAVAEVEARAEKDTD